MAAVAEEIRCVRQVISPSLSLSRFLLKHFCFRFGRSFKASPVGSRTHTGVSAKCKWKILLSYHFEQTVSCSSVSIGGTHGIHIMNLELPSWKYGVWTRRFFEPSPDVLYFENIIFPSEFAHSKWIFFLGLRLTVLLANSSSHFRIHSKRSSIIWAFDFKKFLI